MDDADTLRIEPHVWRQGGQVVDFAILIKGPQLDGDWAELARVDCCHGHVHAHHHNGNVRTIAPLHQARDVADNLEAALIYAETYATSIRDVKENHG